MKIRLVKSQDIDKLKQVLAHCDLFPPEYLDDMIFDYLHNPDSEDIWFTAEHNGGLLSIAYCAPEKFTFGTWNLYAIGVHEHHQSTGIGTEMLNFIEEKLYAEKQRLLIIETSSSEEQIAARNFYKKCGYHHEATINEFWDKGVDKVIYKKFLKSKSN